MTDLLSQAHPPSEAQQLQDARTANEQLRVRLKQTEEMLDRYRTRNAIALRALKRQRAQIEELTRIVGTETPIGALNLATTWQAEKAHMMDQLATYRRQYGLLFDAARAVVASGKANELWMGIDPAALDALTRCVSSTEAEHEPAPAEETQALERIRAGEGNSYQLASNGLGLCPRCGSPLNNVSPGISVVAGGISVCTTCLRPGEDEILRARSL